MPQRHRPKDDSTLRFLVQKRGNDQCDANKKLGFALTFSTFASEERSIQTTKRSHPRRNQHQRRQIGIFEKPGEADN